jgi:hypothetical protein
MVKRSTDLHPRQRQPQDPHRRPPVNPSALEGGLTPEQNTAWIREQEEISEENLTPQKISGSKFQATKALQAIYDDWEQRNDTVMMELYFACSADVQSGISRRPTAKAMWGFLEKQYNHHHHHHHHYLHPYFAPQRTVLTEARILGPHGRDGCPWAAGHVPTYLRFGRTADVYSLVIQISLSLHSN